MRNSIERAAVLFFSAAWAFPLAGCGAGGAPAAEVVVSDKAPPEVRRLAADMELEFSDPNAPVGPDGETPLIVAAKAGNAAHVRRLIVLGAVVNLGDNNGRFPLWFAVRENRVKIAELLMDAGANAGEGMLHAAARGDAAEMVRLLVVRGNADVNARNDAGETPLHIAAAHDAAEVIRNLLIHPDADVNARNDAGETPLHIAATRNAAEVVRNLLIHPDANVNARTPDGRTPMHYAAERDAVAAAEILLSRPGAQIDAADDEGNTALHIAALHDANRVAALLYGAGADDTAKNQAGKTALEIAKGRINPEFVPTPPTAAEKAFAEGMELYNSRGISRDLEKAEDLFLRAANDGHADAENMLGKIYYERGDGQECLRRHEKLLATRCPHDLRFRFPFGRPRPTERDIERSYELCDEWREGRRPAWQEIFNACWDAQVWFLLAEARGNSAGAQNRKALEANVFTDNWRKHADEVREEARRKMKAMKKVRH